MPDWFPNPKRANQISGAAEIALGLGMCVATDTSGVGTRPGGAGRRSCSPRTSTWRRNGVELKPVDGKMTRSVGTASGPQNWIRLPLQAPLAWWLSREARAA